MDHQDPVRQCLDLVKILGNQEHSGTTVPRLDQPCMDIGNRADINPRVGWLARMMSGSPSSARPGSASACCRPDNSRNAHPATGI
jgi:hypothetical protein